ARCGPHFGPRGQDATGPTLANAISEWLKALPARAPPIRSRLGGSAAWRRSVRFGREMNVTRKRLRLWFLALLAIVAGPGASPCPASPADAREAPESLDLGYRRLYSLDFDGAARAFASWQQERPDDPRGPVSEAAGLLFSELHRLGILETQFFVDDGAFRERRGRKPDPQVKVRFDASLERAETLARRRVEGDPSDTDALFALALASGLKADYLSLIEARNVAALSPTKHATEWAEKLLRVDPAYADAYLATG